MAEVTEILQALGIMGGLFFLALALTVYLGGDVKVSEPQPTAKIVDDSGVKMENGELVMIDEDLLEALGDLYAEAGVGGLRYNFYSYLNHTGQIRKKKIAWKAGAIQ